MSRVFVRVFLLAVHAAVKLIPLIRKIEHVGQALLNGSDAARVLAADHIGDLLRERQLPLFDDIDIIQVGARNMQNFNLLKVLGAQDKPVMIKRGMSSTYEEWLMSAEYVMANGNEQVILCERGIRTFETYTRNTLDLAAIPVLRTLTHLPIIIDPSHATGKSALVAPLAMGAVATGADGLIIEVHNDPAHAWCDGPQSLKPEAFDELAGKLISLHSFMRAEEAKS